MRLKQTVKLILFFVILALLVYPATLMLSNPADGRLFQNVAGFYAEEDETLDAVYIGSSNCYAFWNPALAWGTHGIAVYPYATAAQSIHAAEYIMREVRKTQPQAMFVVNINTLENLESRPIQDLLHFMPESENRTALQNHLADLAEMDGKDRMAFRFPYLIYHNQWAKMRDYSYVRELLGLKGAGNYRSYLGERRDVREQYFTTSECTELSERWAGGIESLLDYCDAEQVNAVFVSVPRVEVPTELTAYNTIAKMIEERGYPVLMLTDKVEEIGLDLSQDFYDLSHTNIHGSFKFTQYLADYLVANYPMEDKRGKAGYESWDKSWELYEEGMAPYALMLETDTAHRDYTIPMPGELQAKEGNGSVNLSWQASEGAEGYLVYRKDGLHKPWQEIAATAETTYLDAGCPQEGTPYYTIVPYRQDGGERYHGNFLVLGQKLKR